MAFNSTPFEAGLEVFGPQMHGPNHFDFSPLFEYTILSILPSALLLVLLPFRLWSLYGQSRKVSHSFLQSNKLVCISVDSPTARGYVLMSNNLLLDLTRGFYGSPGCFVDPLRDQLSCAHTYHISSNYTCSGRRIGTMLAFSYRALSLHSALFADKYLSICHYFV